MNMSGSSSSGYSRFEESGRKRGNEGIGVSLDIYQTWLMLLQFNYWDDNDLKLW
jgi:hypothetical protein